MPALESALRRQLEKAITQARDVAEVAARSALQKRGVHEASPYAHFSAPDKKLRGRLRARGQQAGDIRNPDETQSIDHLTQELAYEYWHRMLFARFLAENQLLMHPDGVAVSLEECDELATDAKPPAANGFALAARFAGRMLPQIFRADDVLLEIDFAPEHRLALEKLLSGLPVQTFQADDSLGWVYQFWQSKKKEEVNASGNKIGADELPAVTQLFTEPYMVSFLLDNTLGAWWAARTLTPSDLAHAPDEETLRQKASRPGIPLEYLRFVKQKVESASSRFIANQEHPQHQELGYFNKDEAVTNLSGNLPHWRQEGVSYFVTFRTADSIPQEKLRLWLAEKDEWLKAHPEPHDEQTRREFYKNFTARFQKWIDQGYGECLLGQSKYYDIVKNALLHFDGERYALGDFVIMPNHVHAIVTPKNGNDLSDILHSWKSFTANQINKLSGNTGAFWQKESYDHILRGPEQLEKIIAYIRSHSAYVLDQNLNTGDQRQDSGFTGIGDQRQDAASTGLDSIWALAGGSFDQWPENLADLRVIDPCCGSGHFLVGVLMMLVPMRMAREGLSAADAVDAVLSQNLHGLELDPRCIEIAAFALAMSAWKLAGYRPLPKLNLACSGLSPNCSEQEWLKIVENSGLPLPLRGRETIRDGLLGLHQLFSQAPTLGSLIDPGQQRGNLITADYETLAPYLSAILKVESPDDDFHERAVRADGMSKAAELLAGTYHWVITNVPYLVRGKQCEPLQKFCDKYYAEAKNDLATVFIDRSLALCDKGGTVSLVLPQNWLFLTSYKKFREKLLNQETWHLIARLGPGAFETISGEVVKAILISLSRGREMADGNWSFAVSAKIGKPGWIRGLDVSEPRTGAEKAAELMTAEVKFVGQAKQLENPDSRVSLDDKNSGELLELKSNSYHGLTSGDMPRMKFYYWELNECGNIWIPFQGTVKNNIYFGGNETLLRWDGGEGAIKEIEGARKDGTGAWGKKGVLVSQMNHLPVTFYNSNSFDNNTAVIVPSLPNHLTAIWCFCTSPEYNEAVRRIDQKLNVTNATLVKVPFDLAYWTKVAEEKYPNGLPKPYTDDPTQWIFHGHPCGSVVWDESAKWTAHGPLRTDETFLQVAIARLLGYRWPAELQPSRSGFQPPSSESISNSHQPPSSESISNSHQPLSSATTSNGLQPVSVENGRNGLQPLSLSQKRQDDASTAITDDSEMELADEQRAWVDKCEDLLPLADNDGIVCLPGVREEVAASERLMGVLRAAWGDNWTESILHKILTEAGCKAGTTLDDWLRNQFFEQHCKLFQNRPFIWHIWDGRKDGFSALVNYHKLTHKTLENLTYSYLGDWISAQSKSNKAGADLRLAAAQQLQGKLKLILAGEPPYDIFVRWKPLHEQSIGWQPDLNDGVRMNIRPFMEAGILRKNPNIKWTKDRGKEPDRAKVDYPWFCDGDRINDVHLTNSEKQSARDRIKLKGASHD